MPQACTVPTEKLSLEWKYHFHAKSIKHIRILELSEDIEDFADAIRSLSNLLSLDLHQCHVSTGSALLFSALSQQPNIRTLDCEGSQICPGRLSDMLEVAGAHLEYLNIRCNQFNEPHLRSLESDPRQHDITRIEIGSIQRVDEDSIGMLLKIGLRCCVTLRLLGLDYCEIGDNGAILLSESLQCMSQLEQIGLNESDTTPQSSRISSRGVHRLAEAFAPDVLPFLHNVEMAYCILDDGSCLALAKAVERYAICDDADEIAERGKEDHIHSRLKLNISGNPTLGTASLEALGHAMGIAPDDCFHSIGEISLTFGGLWNAPAKQNHK